MIIGIVGPQGSGKTLVMSMLSYYFSNEYKAPLFSNYKLFHSEKIKSLYQVLDLKKAIFAFDEIWVSVDSRLFKDNVRMTRWINQTRKKSLVVFYTSQTLGQLDKRFRDATDILIECYRKKNGIILLRLFDWQQAQYLHTFLIQDPSVFFDLYDSYEIQEVLT